MLIRILQLYTNNLKAQYEFYIVELGFKLLDRSDASFSFQAGSSQVIIHEELEENLHPIHFAFALQNIRMEKVCQSLMEFIELIPNQRNDHFIVDFFAWEAKSIYFYDADKNIVEFILRERDSSEVNCSFSSDHISSICEVGMPVKNCIKIANTLKKELGLVEYKGASDQFIPLGDDIGLLIVVEEGVKKWFPTQQISKYSILKLEFKVDDKIKTIIIDKEDFKIF